MTQHDNHSSILNLHDQHSLIHKLALKLKHLDDDGQFDHQGPPPDHGHHPPPPPPHKAVEYRSIDGSGNNLNHTDLNAAGTDFARIGQAHFADGASEPLDGPNPRMISNVVVGQGEADVPNLEGLSGLMYAWGQFIDHDLDLAKSDGVHHIDITIPAGDAIFPDGSVISLTRSIIDPTTGTDAAHPATPVNFITGWLDASMVYGSDAATAASLRLADGHLKTSAGDNLPIVNGMFAAGDVRAAENPDLTALQTLFVREHNYQVDLLHHQHPTWDGEHLYQQARAIVAAEIAHITYSEFLPHLLGPDKIPDYHGYDSTVDSSISVEFAVAAYRFGHSIVSQDIEKIGEQGQELAPAQDLMDTFFESTADFVANSGADALLRALSSDQSRALDARIIDDLRNFLFDPPDGMDLAAINIERGRDQGVGTLNQTREALGLDPYTDFSQITSDPGTLAALQTAFTSVDQIDLWTGGLSENHMPGAMLGETFQAIIAMQFEALRDGDRFWFENQGFDAKTLDQIEHTTLADIILRDTDTQHIQDDVFVFFERHSGTKGGVDAEDPDAPQLVIGSNGKDTLIGGPQGDYLFAATGKQTMTGGDGADKFVFSNCGTDAKITDFVIGVDLLVFDDAGKLDFHDVHIKADHGNAVVDVGGDHIVLLGINASHLSSHDFLFVA